jgi:UDP-3-O-[3-hydroxymyristoyl] glucosamine N-acyltransferase
MALFLPEIVDFLKRSNAKFSVSTGTLVSEMGKIKIAGPSNYCHAGISSFTFLSKDWQNRDGCESNASLVLTDKKAFAPKDNQVAIHVESPKFWFSKFCKQFFDDSQLNLLVKAEEIIDELKAENRIGTGCMISKDSFLNKHITIGRNVSVYPGACIYGNSVIKDGSLIGPGVVIGKAGFALERLEGEVAAMPHYGGVIVGRGVQVGANTCIDRGQFGNTEIGDNVKIDNLVHIAHNCVIEAGTFVIAGAVLCGSVKVGRDVWVGASASVRQSLSVGDFATIGMGAVVVKDVQEESTVAGNPARVIDKQ